LRYNEDIKNLGKIGWRDVVIMGMTQEKLYNLIQLQPEIIQKLKLMDSHMDMKAVENELNQMVDRKSSWEAYQRLKTIFQEDEEHLRMLYCQLECACRIYEKYVEKNIPVNIYIDTMKCFTRFMEECKKKNGRMFFDRGWWTYRQVSMSLFRIGALEYEFKEYNRENVIAVHIPSDADLSPASVSQSMEQAEKFFKAYYSDYQFCKYTCNSWLLSPVLKPLLSRESNILSFQERFDIIEENQDDKEFLEWLFQAPADTEYSNLPSVTSLQKRVKTLLQNGRTVGSAYGILKKRCRNWIKV